MSLLQWKQEYSVGIESMDDEHRQLIDLINGVYAKLDAKSDALQIETCLGDIFNAIAMHFALEERIMRAHNYDEFDAHKEDHEELLDEIRDLMEEFVSDPDAGAVALKKRLSDWFADHFATFDARLHGSLGV